MQVKILEPINYYPSKEVVERIRTSGIFNKPLSFWFEEIELQVLVDKQREVR